MTFQMCVLVPVSFRNYIPNTCCIWRCGWPTRGSWWGWKGDTVTVVAVVRLEIVKLAVVVVVVVRCLWKSHVVRLVRIWIRKRISICRRYWKREAAIFWSHIISHLACSFVSGGVSFRSFTNDSMKGYLCRLKSASKHQTAGQYCYAE